MVVCRVLQIILKLVDVCQVIAETITKVLLFSEARYVLVQIKEALFMIRYDMTSAMCGTKTKTQNG